MIPRRLSLTGIELSQFQVRMRSDASKAESTMFVFCVLTILASGRIRVGKVTILFWLDTCTAVSLSRLNSAIAFILVRCFIRTVI